MVSLPRFSPRMGPGEPNGRLIALLSRPILVTYATRSGSTAGVAETIAQTLRETGATVELRPIEAVSDIAPYSAVVLGSPIQGREWLPEAIQFVRTHQAALARKPFATFTLCMAMAMDGAEQYRQGVAEWLAPVRRLAAPVSEGIFAGVLDIRKVPTLGYRIAFRLAVLAGAWKEGDHRDWNAIRAWAKGLGRDLKPALTPAAHDHAV